MSRWYTFRTAGPLWSAEVGRISIECDTRRGGRLTLASGPLRVEVATRVELDCAHTPGAPDFGKTVLIRQEEDAAPELLPVEEGPQRLALRVLYKLLDADGHYHGDGLQEFWLYPEGEIFFAFGLRLVDSISHPALRGAAVEFRTAGAPLAPPTGWRGGATFGAALPDKRLLLTAPDRNALGLYWTADAGAARFSMDFQTPPFYHRWPHLFHQWGTHKWETRGWAVHPTSKVTFTPDARGALAAMRWLDRAQLAPGKEHAFYGLLGLSLGATEAETRRRAAAHQAPLAPKVTGGTLRGYDPVDAVYEVMKTDDRETTIEFPADAHARLARVRLFNLRGQGAVLAELDRRRLDAQLLSQGRCTDDPLVPVRVMPHGAADELIAAVPLRPDAPARLTVRETPGIHAAYQMRDAWRSILPWRTGARHADMEFSLRDGRGRRLRKPRADDEAVAEHPFFWLLHCGYSPSHYVNLLRDFEVAENGPDRLRFRYVSTNLGERIRNETEVTLPCDPRDFRMHTRHAFTTLGQWEHGAFEFSDTFPFITNDPRRWYYDRVLYVPAGAPARRIDTRGTLDGERAILDFTTQCCFVMLSSARGNLFTLVRNPTPPATRLRAHLCGCWIDLHLDILCDTVPLPPGSSLSVETDFALHGDEHMTDAQAIAIAERSLAANALVL
jgi:hypothetical protein